LPRFFDQPRQPRARRPGSVRQALVPSAFRQVSTTCSCPTDAHGLERAPDRTNDSPTTDAVRADLHAGLACESSVSLHRHLPSRISLNRACRTPSGSPPSWHVQEGEPLLSRTCVLISPTLSSVSSLMEGRPRWSTCRTPVTMLSCSNSSIAYSWCKSGTPVGSKQALLQG
jgi:hypothetical protein